MAWDDPIVWILIIDTVLGFTVLVVYGIFYIARLLYKANKVVDLQLEKQRQEKTNSQHENAQR